MSRFILPFQSVYDLNGHPLDGAKLYFYETGTSTPKDTYSDQALSVANANPVIADNTGEFGEIFLDGVYRVELQDKDGVTQPNYPADSVQPFQEADVYETVAAMKLASLDAGHWVATKGYYTAGDGAGATYWIDTLVSHGAADTFGDHALANTNVAVLQGSGALNVMQYGAKADGVTDDSPPVQAAIDAATLAIPSIGSEVTGQVVSFPAGHYIIETNLTLTNNAGVSLHGAGKTKSTLEISGSATRLLDFSNSNNYRGEVRGLRLTGGIGGHAADLIYIGAAGNQIDIVDNWIDSATGGIYANPFADGLISGNTFEFINKPIYGGSMYDLIIKDNMFYGYGAKGTGIQPNNFDFVDSYRCVFENNKIIYDSTLSDVLALINIETSSEIIVRGNIVYDRATSPFSRNIVRVKDSEKIIVNGNTFGRTALATINVEGSKGVSICGNALVGCTDAAYWPITIALSSEDVTIDGNEFAQVAGVSYTNLAGSWDIFLDGCTRVTITNNKLRKQIYVQSNSSRYFIEGNMSAIVGVVVVYYHTAAPTSGAWEVGDKIYLATPVAGGVIGYACTASGAPGTWKGFGTIAA